VIPLSPLPSWQPKTKNMDPLYHRTLLQSLLLHCSTGEEFCCALILGTACMLTDHSPLFRTEIMFFEEPRLLSPNYGHCAYASNPFFDPCEWKDPDPPLLHFTCLEDFQRISPPILWVFLSGWLLPEFLSARTHPKKLGLP